MKCLEKPDRVSSGRILWRSEVETFELVCLILKTRHCCPYFSRAPRLYSIFRPQGVCLQDILDKLSSNKSRIIRNKPRHMTKTRSPGSKVIKLFSCSTQLSMKFFMLIHVTLKLLTMPMSFLQNIAEHESFSANKYENANNIHIY